MQTLARLLEEAGAVPVICGIPLNTTLEERITLLLDRIAALEADNAVLSDERDRAIERHNVAHETIAALREELAAAERKTDEAQERLAMVAWLPMETAPKDGSRVLLLTVEHTRLGPGGAITFPPTVHTGWWNPEGDAWVDECGSFDGDADHLAQTGSWSSSTGWFQPNEVSHWMPIAAILPHAATAEAVAQHTDEVERRGAARLQQRVAAWVRSRIGDEHMQPKERALRLLEETCELAQAHGIPQESVVKQVAHVFGRPTGEPCQEAAGVAVCLLGWCAATENNMLDLAVREIERIEAKPISQIRGSVARKASAGLIACEARAAELEKRS